jgi:signal transduction histidine kinase
VLRFSPREAADAGPARPAAPAPRGRLFRKYVLFFVGLVAAALLVNGGLDFWFGYQENKAGLIRIQQQKADAAAERIEGFIESIQRQIGWTTHPQWSAAPLDQRRFDYVRLLSQVPAITEISEIDRDGREQLKVSRLAVDAIGSGRDLSQTPAFVEARAHKVWFSPVYFRKQSEPYMTLAVARAGRNAGVTVAEVNLMLIWDVITRLKIGSGGYAYVVDNRGRLIAHPDISLVLRDTDYSHLSQVEAALGQQPDRGGAENAVSVARDGGGRSVLSAQAAIAPLGWLVFAEVPLTEAFAPLYGAALRSAALLAFGLTGATFVALFLARRMTGPIREMQEGAARLGAGDLDRRLDIHTGDEFEALAQQFNRMAADLQTSYAELEQKVEERTAELSEALDQQTATAEVLQVINSSPGNLTPVFDAMLEKAMRLCEAAFGQLAICDGGHFRTAATRGMPEAFVEYRRRNPPEYGPGTQPARLLAGERLVQVIDLKAEAAYLRGEPNRRALVDLGGVRTSLMVPLRREDTVLGFINLYRQEVRAFSDEQVALLQNFAAQAVIAIDNARLITETRKARDAAEVALRELKTAQASLIQAEKMASLGQLTAGIAHEIKNPLNFVNNFAGLSRELLDELKEIAEPAIAALDTDKRDELDETIEMLTGNLEKIAEHGRRADNIVKGMLEHSRGTSGERRSVDLNALIDEALNLAYHGARAQDQRFNISLERDFDPALKPIEVAPQDITRVFINIFGNGFYAANKRAHAVGNGTDAGFRPVLRVTTHEAGDAVEVRVRDNGTGIPRDVKDKLFQPFFTTKPTGEGTGLGLSISYDIVTQQHGGSIAVDSEEGAFTEFTIRLPRGGDPLSGEFRRMNVGIPAVGR